MRNLLRAPCKMKSCTRVARSEVLRRAYGCQHALRSTSGRATRFWLILQQALNGVTLRLGVSGALVGLVGCQQEMAKQPSFRPLQASAFFADEQASRPPLAGTV